MNKPWKRLQVFIFMILSIFFFICSGVQKGDIKEIIQRGLLDNSIAYKLTEPEEINKLFGPPVSSSQKKDGGMLGLVWTYPDTVFFFAKMNGDNAPFTLRRIRNNNIELDIGATAKVVLRDNNDLKKIDRFWGLQNLSLINVDLRSQGKLLKSLAFDSITDWPPADRLPPGFDPETLLESGKNPGLGVRSLHEQGLTGKGVGLAIIDQPLLLGHSEYSSRLVRYDASGLAGFSPQMHASPVASIAVGEKTGVAPGAELTFFAVPMWERDNAPYIRALTSIINLNKVLPAEEKIRVISISTGMFPHYPRFKEWQLVLKSAEDAGIFVITCDQATFEYGTLILAEGLDPDRFENYRAGYYLAEGDRIRVPAANKTIASHRGIEVYTFERQGGMSWGAPYIAGLAALAFQVNPNITPVRIRELLVETVIKTDAGPVVNPVGFITRVREGNG